MNPPTSSAAHAEKQIEFPPITRPIQATPELPYNDIIGKNLDILEDTLPDVLKGYSSTDFHLVRSFGKALTKHPIAYVSACIDAQGELQQLSTDQNDLLISKYRTELTVMRKKPLSCGESITPQMKAPFEIVDVGDFYQRAGRIVVDNVINSILRFNGPRQERHETQIC